MHDKLAERAAAMGKTAEDFHVAAQKHANAAWFFLIVAGVVWYFLAWTWALIPAAIGIFSAFQSVSSTMIESKLENLDAGSSTGDSS
jgi:hypothetical protein